MLIILLQKIYGHFQKIKDLHKAMRIAHILHMKINYHLFVEKKYYLGLQQEKFLLKFLKLQHLGFTILKHKIKIKKMLYLD